MKRRIITIFAISAILLSGCGKLKPGILYNEAWNYYDRGDFDNAAMTFELAIEKEGATEENLRALGITYLVKEQYTEARDTFLKALGAHTGRLTELDYDTNRYLGLTFEKLSDYKSAAEVYTAILDLKKKDYDSYYRRGVCYLNLSDKTSAEADFAKFTGAYKNDFEKHVLVYKAYCDAEYETDGESYLKAYYQANEKSLTDYEKGVILYYLKDYSNARTLLESAKSMSNPDTILMLGETYEAIGDYSYAASLYNAYLTEKGNNASLYNRLGIAKMKSGDYEGALLAFNSGLNLKDSEFEKVLLFNEAVCYEYLLDFTTAKEKMAAYVAKYPWDKTAEHELIFLETR
ncbi:MAG: tetratricopeptide repeat protein [Lachnospiraceae bacterium]|nr:tetratricopeptide repeat protein [Lachnospiraceae bacterium]